MKTACFLVALPFLLPVLLCAADKPNIIVILSDDYGYGSAGCYGAPPEMKTPNLDRLAKEGRRFTNAYAPGSVCSPTRYGLMTGRYYWRTSVKDGEVLGSGSALHIETSRLTLGSLCKGQGYATAAVGKWHLGMGDGSLQKRGSDWGGELRPGPREVGFDYFFGLASNPWSGPHNFIENDQILEHLPGQPVVMDGNKSGSTSTGLVKQWQEDHIMETITGKATGWMEQHAGAPFFLYFAPNAIHEPVAPNPRFTGSKFGRYGDFIHELDWSVGRVLDTLDKLKLTENTLVIFSSDNGGVVSRNNPNASAAMDAGLPINGTLKGGKHDVWEGGFREPFLVRWPGRVPAGTVSAQVIGITDVLATLASILKAPLPDGPHAEDSRDVSAAFLDKDTTKPMRDSIVLQAADATYALRRGDWKLIERENPPPFEHRNAKKAEAAEKKKRGAAPHDELYNLAEDPAETKDVSAEHPEIVAELRSLLKSARDNGRSR